MIKFGEWLPDLADYQNQGVLDAKNTIPAIDGYKQFLSLSAATSVLDSYPRGAFSVTSSTRNNYNYAGSGTKLYQLAGDTWTDQSKASGTYAIQSDDSWEFVKWGETVIAVGGINSGTPIPPQVIVIGGVGGTEFADLGGSPPQSRHIAVVRDFVMLGNIYEDATLYPSRVRWSGINSSTTWGTDPQTQSDFQDLGGEGGWIQGIRGGQYGIVFQDRSIWRMEYMGPPTVFSFDEIFPGIGTSAPNSIVQYGNDIFFLGQTGFKVLGGGREIVDIGKNKIDRWFYANVDKKNLHRVVGAMDRRNRRIYWTFPSVNASDGSPDYVVIFDLNSSQWSRLEHGIFWIWDALGEDFTLEGLDAVSASLDALPFSLDSTAWVGGDVSVAGFDSSFKSGNFDGTALNASIKTAEYEIDPIRSKIDRTLPVVDGAGTIRVAAGVRDDQTGSIIWTTERSAERDATYAFRINSRYVRFEVIVEDGFTHASGIHVVDSKKSTRY